MAAKKPAKAKKPAAKRRAARRPAPAKAKRAMPKPHAKVHRAAPHARQKPASAKAATPKAAAKIQPKPAPRAALKSAPPLAPKVATKGAPATKPAPVSKVVPVRPAVPAARPRPVVLLPGFGARPVGRVPGPSADGDEEQAEGALSLLAGPRNVKPYLAKKGEQYMGKAQLEHFRTILLSWKRDLMEEVDRTVTHMKDEAANPPDPNDRATLESEFSLELRTRDRERKLIRKIDEALARIEDGSYGYCLETGEEIGIKRLEARPVATLSIEAQERRERREKQYGDRDDRYR